MLLFFFFFRHGAALKKNISNLSRRVFCDAQKAESEELNGEDSKHSKPGTISWPKPVKSRKFSEAVDIEAIMSMPLSPGRGRSKITGSTRSTNDTKYEIVKAKFTNVSLKTISLTYGWSQVVTAFVGGFAITPSGKRLYLN